MTHARSMGYRELVLDIIRRNKVFTIDHRACDRLSKEAMRMRTKGELKTVYRGNGKEWVEHRDPNFIRDAEQQRLSSRAQPSGGAPVLPSPGTAGHETDGVPACWR